ncbi:nucleotidyltransferase [Flavobacterium cerinum]|uniref:Nucleotidyltransferase n=1 Tax=Flavobacterium cerinum TaxID=2502784 RepID=A0A3S4T1X9_9FLAO|nr:nucleotidyltransferase [Flavobacterium cerinum]RWX00906.1 nucleotidyltransferase [Flavobacterium cerinum]
MARTQAEIKQEITKAFMANAIFSMVYGFPVGGSFEVHFSLLSLENLWFDIISFAHRVHEQFFDQHTKEVNEKLANQKAGTLPWYRTMALRFLWGFSLVIDQDYFNTAGATTEQIEAAKIVKYAAVDQATLSSRVIIKVAGENNGKLEPIQPEQKEALEAYINEVKFAGVTVNIINYLPDRLYLTIEIKRDALVLSASGQSILNGNYPVNDAIAKYMKELPFNGELRLSALVDRLQVVPGVIDATILNAESAWINPDTNGYGDAEQITIAVIPVSGYFEVVTFDNITYVV